MKLSILSLALLIFAFNANANNATTHTTNRDDGSKIVYYLLSQSQKKPSDTLLLILQGSDCNSVLNNESIFTDYMNVWPGADILIIEKYGIDNGLSYSTDAERNDCPAQYIQNDSPEQRAADVATVLRLLKMRNDYPEIIVLGGSEGAVVANLVSARVNDISATVSFNGGGRKFIDDVIHSIRAGSASKGEAEESVNSFEGFSNHILNGGPSELQVSGHGYRWWFEMLSIDQLETLKKVNSPLLIIQGGRDLSVSPQKADEMILALEESGKYNIESLKYQELDHQFNSTDGTNKRKRVIADINAWLKSKLGKSDKSPLSTVGSLAD